MMKKILNYISVVLLLSLGINVATPTVQVFADSHYSVSSSVVLAEDRIIINGKSYNEEEFNQLLETAIYQPPVQTRSAVAIGGAAAYAGSYFIPGVGQVLLLGTGAVILAGVTIYATHWAAQAVKNFFNNEDNMTANDIISNRRKAGVRGAFPGEYLNKTLGEIKKDAKAGKARARKAKKLLEDGRFTK